MPGHRTPVIAADYGLVINTAAFLEHEDVVAVEMHRVWLGACVLEDEADAAVRAWR